jgi:L-ascorbate metabolism protein UlaG (beta-lactamase superfamily)
MKVKWIGHACFLITAKNGLRVIVDPYAVGGGINYCPINETADVVLVSHDHGDHNNTSAVKGQPQVIRGSGEEAAKGVRFRGIATYHDASRGRQRGPNIVFCFSIDDTNLCHLGDLGHELGAGEVERIGAVDILFIPVGGLFTIDASVANRVCDQLKPKIAIPMHFKTPGCAYSVAGVEDFLKDKPNVKRIAGSEVEFEQQKLPARTEIVLLRPAS